jgi:peptidoglycan/xylan/chitin deacetylase (PgdA/CDA1 family)
MYHYVRPASSGLPFFRYLHIEDFRRQLDHFQREYRLIDRRDFLASLDGVPAPEDAMVLTFDDGLVDHYRHVLPELRARGLWGIFYVPTAPLVTGRLLDVHRVHLLLGRHGGTAAMDLLSRTVEDHMLVDRTVPEFRELTYRGRDEDANTTLFKRTLNYYIGYEWREEVLDRVWAQLDEGLPGAGEWYMSREALRDLVDEGMLVGSHSVNHRVFAKLALNEQSSEIDESFALLDAITGGLAVRTFCYPYGGFFTFTAETEHLLSSAGCRFSFNVEHRDITLADLTSRPHALPRYDCNYFPHGLAAAGPRRTGVTEDNLARRQARVLRPSSTFSPVEEPNRR